MIKELINEPIGNEEIGVHGIFGLDKTRYDALYNEAVDTFNKYFTKEDQFASKSEIIKILMELAQTPNEEACLLFYAGQFIGELQFKNQNPLMAILSKIH